MSGDEEFVKDRKEVDPGCQPLSPPNRVESSGMGFIEVMSDGGGAKTQMLIDNPSFTFRWAGKPGSEAAAWGDARATARPLLGSRTGGSARARGEGGGQNTFCMLTFSFIGPSTREAENGTDTGFRDRSCQPCCHHAGMAELRRARPRA
jgi:hypothetical protein